MNAEEQLEFLLAEHGFVLIRKKNHRVYRNATGLQFTIACTASDVRAYKNALADFKRIVGIQPQGGKPGVRRVEKKTNHLNPAPLANFESNIPARPTWQDQLAAVRPQPPAPVVQVAAPVPQVEPSVPKVPLKRDRSITGAVRVYGFLSDAMSSALRKAGLID